jgi:DNA polymerase-4
MAEPLSILHVDMDAFYASVEVRDDPSLAGLPVAVGGPARGRGVIAAASYEARRFGVRSAIPTSRALQLCPELVVLPPDFDRYTAESRRIMEIFRSYTPLVEPLSLDEAFLDVAGCERLFGDSIEIARSIKRDILRETALVASVGVASSKFVAKLASDMDKPDGFRVIRPEEVRAVLDPLPVSRIFGVGPRTALRLEALGVRTVGDLAALERREVLRRFGASGAWIHDLAHGIDSRRVTPRREERSYSQERTFEADISDREELRLKLLEFCEDVAWRLRNHGLRGRTIAVKARYWNFKTVTRTHTLDFATNLGPRIYAAARELLERVPPGPLRLLGVQVSALEDVRTPVQGQLFGAPVAEPPRRRGESGGGAKAAARGPDGRLELATAGADRMRRKYGRGAVVSASLLGRSATRGRDGSEGRPGVAGRAVEPHGAVEPAGGAG